MKWRLLAALLGAVVFGILVPLITWGTVGIPFGNLTGLLLLVGAGVVAGALLGFVWPKVFLFLIEAVFEI